MTGRQQECGPARVPGLDPYGNLNREIDRLVPLLLSLKTSPPARAAVGRVDGMAGQLATMRRNVLRLKASDRHGH